MGFEPASMAEKLGNRYEGRWVAVQLLKLINEEINSITVEPIGPLDQGVDLLVIKKDGIKVLQQVKSRIGSKESWTISILNSIGIFNKMRNHLDTDLKCEFALVSAIPFRKLADICESARMSDNNPQHFYKYQIKDIGKVRLETFNRYCKALNLNPKDKIDLIKAFDYLKRTYIVLFSDDQNTWDSFKTLAGFLLTGNLETAIAALLTYIEENDKYRKAIYADELIDYLIKKHNINPRNLVHDKRIAPKILELQNQFRDTIQPGLIGGRVISRKETLKIIECINAKQDVVLYGAAGNGKSGILYELSEFLHQNSIPWLPIRLDRRIPEKNAEQFGQDMRLPASPVYSLSTLAKYRKCVLILDQLDAIRWTSTHSRAAMDVCMEIVLQVRNLRNNEGHEIVIVFACRTYDLENDQEIKNLMKDKESQSFVKIQVSELSDDQLKEIIGKDFTTLTESQKHILSCPMNLAIWIELKKDETVTDFNSSRELMRRFWENRLKDISAKANISPEQINKVLEPLLDYIESKGEISVPLRVIEKWSDIKDNLISFGILQLNDKRISFYHQHYLDYLISNRLLQQIDEGKKTILSWLGPKENQSLFRREQLRQVLIALSDESLKDFYQSVKELLESEKVRFHLKHLVLELLRQLEIIPEKLKEYCLSLLDNNYWKQHILETVLWKHHRWILYLLKVNILQKWLSNGKDKDINIALWLLRSVAELIPDKVTEVLAPYLTKGGDWPKRILNTICWKETDDSESMFELRIRLTKMGCFKDFIDWESLCAKHPLRALYLLEAIISTLKSDELYSEKERRRIEKWYDKVLKAFECVAKKYPVETWDLLIGHIERLTDTDIENIYSFVDRWEEKEPDEPEIDITRGTVELVIIAGKTLTLENPEELKKRTSKIENSNSPVIQEIIISVYTHLPNNFAEFGLNWLINDTCRFRLGSGNCEPEWMPAVRLISSLSPYCSQELFSKLEDKIIHYHAPEEKEYAKYCLKEWHNIKYDYYWRRYYWGQAQYFLLPALDQNRISKNTANIIGVLNRRFKNYSNEYFLKRGLHGGGWVGSKLDQNLERISDRAWLKIINCKKVTEHGKQVWMKNHVLETSIQQFSGSLAKIAKRFPERFGRLALKFPDDVHKSYISAILDGFGENQPDAKLSEDEKNAWEPAQIETIEALLEKYKAGDDRDTAMSFCRIISKRAEENWSDKTIDRLIYYAKNHPDLPIGKLNVYCDRNSDEASVEILFQNTINCVRGMAAEAIGQLIWIRKDRLEQVMPGLESLVCDPHPVVRMAATRAIIPIFNINKDLAVNLFCKVCADDLRVAASPRILEFYNNVIPTYIEQIRPVIQQMAASHLSDVSFEGARQVAARHVFHGFFKEEFAQCLKGTIPQRKGVVDAAVFLLNNKKYSEKCTEILLNFLNDPDKEVRDEFRGIFKEDILINNPKYEIFIKEFIRSKAFADDPDRFIWDLKELTGNLLPVADVIFAICEEISTTLKEKIRDNFLNYPDTVLEISSILLRLYDQAIDKHEKEVLNQCLDIWDIFFENRVGRVMELTKAIEK